MQPRRTPFRATLDRLTQEFAHAVVQAVCKATLAEVLGMPDREERPVARPAARPAPRPVAPASPAPRRSARTARTKPLAPASPVPEPEMAEGTEIDAQALLAAIDREPAAAARGRDEARPPTPLVEPPPAAPPSERRSTPSPPLRDGEQAMRTGAGHVVLRRRRSGDAA